VKTYKSGLRHALSAQRKQAPHRYAVKVSDTTMLPMAASLPGQ